MNGVDFFDHRGGQVIQCIAGTAEDLFPKGHQTRQLTAGDARQRRRVAVRVKHEADFAGGRGIQINAHQRGYTAIHNNVLGKRRAEADKRFAVGLEAGVEATELGQLAQQQVALVEQLGWLPVYGWQFSQLFIDLCKLLRQGVDFANTRLNRLLGFGVNQIELRRQLAKPRGQPLRVAQESPAQHCRSRVRRQTAGRGKKLIEGTDQTHGVARHDVDHPVGVSDHRGLALQVGVAVAKVGICKRAVLPLYAVKHHAGANKSIANAAGCTG